MGKRHADRISTSTPKKIKKGSSERVEQTKDNTVRPSAPFQMNRQGETTKRFIVKWLLNKNHPDAIAHIAAHNLSVEIEAKQYAAEDPRYLTAAEFRNSISKQFGFLSVSGGKKFTFLKMMLAHRDDDEPHDIIHIDMLHRDWDLEIKPILRDQPEDDLKILFWARLLGNDERDLELTSDHLGSSLTIGFNEQQKNESRPAESSMRMKSNSSPSPHTRSAPILNNSGQEMLDIMSQSFSQLPVTDHIKKPGSKTELNIIAEPTKMKNSDAVAPEEKISANSQSFSQASWNSNNNNNSQQQVGQFSVLRKNKNVQSKPELPTKPPEVDTSILFLDFNSGTDPRFWLCTSTPFQDHEGRRFFNANQFIFYHLAMIHFDRIQAQAILAATDDKQVIQLSESIAASQDYHWINRHKHIVSQANYFKFTSSVAMKSLLLDTGDRELVFAVYFDAIMGIGMAREGAEKLREIWGQNLLGKALANVRRQIRDEERTAIRDGGQSKAGLMAMLEGRQTAEIAGRKIPRGPSAMERTRGGGS